MKSTQADFAGVDALAAPRDGLEAHHVAVDLDQHEALSVSKPLAVSAELLDDVAGAQLGRAAGGEVVDALLRLEPLVEVLVAGEDDVEVVLDEQRLDDRAQVDFRAVAAARRIERMMEEGNLPLRVRLRQLLLEPALLVLVHVVAVEREEADVLLLIGVEALAVHVEGLVEALVRIVVIAERRIELDVGVEQRLVRALELRDEVLRPLGAVHVVAEHDRELVREHASAPSTSARRRRSARDRRCRCRRCTRNFTESLPIGGCTSTARRHRGAAGGRGCCPVMACADRGERPAAPTERRRMRTGSFFMIDSRQLGMVGTTSRRMSTIRLALTSRRIRLRPTMRYSSSGGRSGQLAQQRRRKRRQRQRRRVDGVDVDLHVLRQLADQRLAIGGRCAPAKSSWTILMKYGWYSGAKISPGLRAGAQRHDRLAERLLAIGDLLAGRRCS